MNRILEKSRRPKCPHLGNKCWYVDADGMCANARRVCAERDPCEHNGSGLMPAIVLVDPGIDRDTWRRDRGL